MSGNMPTPPPMEATTAPELIRQVFAPIVFLIDGLLTDGLYILAGKPKMGKSWLALGLAVAIASGGRALGKIRATKAEVLYLALEDTPRRLQHRLARMIDEPPAGLHLATSMQPIDYGGLQQLHDWLGEHPDIRFVIIDTLARIRSTRKSGSDIYQDDSMLGAALQDFAKVNNLTLLLIHHTRKAAAEDYLDTVSGSTGVTGSADGVMVLTRSRTEADATLHITGRDIEEHDLALRFLPDEGAWDLLGDAREYAVSDERRKILDTITATPGLTPKAISDVTNLKYGSVRHLLIKMRNERLVNSDSKGAYTIVHRVHSMSETPSSTAQTPVNGQEQARSLPFTAPVNAVNTVNTGNAVNRVNDLKREDRQ